ncbi:MAG: SagB/ThcOx family dehydrogenase [Candidatus Sungbacteria bacterium]|nr:SagB/ThcOx family dehydrogenase [Candidatus Sungbacteria bacterium]
MPDPFFDFFYKDRPAIDPEATEWKNISFKEYPRSPRIFLSKFKSFPSLNLAEALLKRRTERNFSNQPISQNVLGRLLFWSAGPIHKLSATGNSFRRPYPSGGARFPVEIYVALFNGKGVKKGAYHYNFLEHSLELIHGADAEKIRQATTYDFYKTAPALILLSFVGERTAGKYGNLGYKLGILEGGHIGQNIYLVGTALGLGVLAIGRMTDHAAVERELDLDAEEETVFYQLAIGYPKK